MSVGRCYVVDNALNSAQPGYEFRTRMTVSFAVRKCPSLISNSIKENSKALCEDKLQSRCQLVLPFHETQTTRRHALIYKGISLVAFLTMNNGLTPLPVWSEEESKSQDDKDESVVGAIKSLFDPNEKTKSGKVLPKAYLKSARELVKTLRESLKEDPKDNAKFRRTADAAKESIREYLSNWRGQQTVTREESYVELEKAIRALAGFYSKAGPSAPLPEEVKSEILNDLSMADEFL